MREDCKFFQLRTYASGEEARFCALDLAPEAPWRCPAGCPRYTRRVEHAGFVTAGGGEAPAAPEPDLHPDAVALLGSAEEIISAVGPEIAAERKRQRQEEERRRGSWWNRLKDRSPRWRR
jgi:hypothetical protein